jgi:DNA-binding XRE family transcriptional regulator
MLKVDEARGRFFHAARILAGLSVHDVSELAFVSRPTILKIESGEKCEEYLSICKFIMIIYRKRISAVFSEENGLASLTFSFQNLKNNNDLVEEIKNRQFEND